MITDTVSRWPKALAGKMSQLSTDRDIAAKPRRTATQGRVPQPHEADTISSASLSVPTEHVAAQKNTIKSRARLPRARPIVRKARGVRPHEEQRRADDAEQGSRDTVESGDDVHQR